MSRSPPTNQYVTFMQTGPKTLTATDLALSSLTGDFDLLVV
jgi:hypothetical protein